MSCQMYLQIGLKRYFRIIYAVGCIRAHSKSVCNCLYIHILAIVVIIIPHQLHYFGHKYPTMKSLSRPLPLLTYCSTILALLSLHNRSQQQLQLLAQIKYINHFYLGTFRQIIKCAFGVLSLIIMNLPSTAKQQPPTSGKVVVFTSNGEIQIELWCREAPLASRNFVKHCLDGYYNNLIFHRIIPGFMMQGGDPTGTGTGGQSIYGQPFKDEFHQRLRFNRRGIVAMANSGKNTNASQFFITFGECEHLNKKHTIFGKVVGDTVYNLMAMQSLDTEEGDRPTNPPVIRRTKVVLNPFDDLVEGKGEIKQEETKLQKEKQGEALKVSQEQNKAEMKKLKKKNKLSFDCEEQDGGYKVKSSHDMLKDSNLSSQLALNAQDLARRLKDKEEEEQKKREMKDRVLAGPEGEKQLTSLLSQELHKKRKLNQQLSAIVQDEVLNYNTVYNPETQRKQITWQKPIAQQSQNEEDDKLRAARQLQKQQCEGMVADQLNFKRIKQGSRRQKRKMLLSQQVQLLSNAERIRYQFLKKNQQQKTESSLFDKLNDFTSKLKTTGGKETGWMKHQLKFHIDSENAFKLDEKKRLVHEVKGELQDDGGLKVQIERTVPLNAQFNVDELYDMIHNEE